MSLLNAVEKSVDAVWPLKDIQYPPGSQKTVKIISQNRNGPCSLIALSNILILRGDIRILPSGRKSASYEFLAGLVGDFLVNSHTNRPEFSDADLTAAFGILPSTQEGMDLNPLFTGVSAFRPGGDGGALKLFQLCNIILVHGWLADPGNVSEYHILSKAGDYDTALNMIVAGEEASSDVQETPTRLNEDTRVQDGLALRMWLDANPTQLTYHGLFSLINLESGLYALIRNSHLSVLQRTIDEDGNQSLYVLVTDSNFALEPSIVWESLRDVDGADCAFYDSDLHLSAPFGGDFAGQSEAALSDSALDSSAHPEFDADLLLAQQLQAQEDDLARQLEQTRLEERLVDPVPQSEHRPDPQAALDDDRPRLKIPSKPTKPVAPSKSKNDCIIM